MRPLIRWMNKTDNAILDFLDGHEAGDFRAPPMTIAVNIGQSRTYVGQRARGLADVGLLVQVEGSKGYYQLSDLGRRYLANELNEPEGEQLEQGNPHGSE
jgi:hypothetical protein